MSSRLKNNVPSRAKRFHLSSFCPFVAHALSEGLFCRLGLVGLIGVANPACLQLIRVLLKGTLLLSRLYVYCVVAPQALTSHNA